jgi:transposase InsO family protein
MNTNTDSVGSPSARWARFRFSIIGPLLSSPPESGELKAALEVLSKKTWRHPVTQAPVSFSLPTLERWLYRAKKTGDPVGALRTKRRSDAASSRVLSAPLMQVLKQQHREHPSWSYQLHLDNLAACAKADLSLGKPPSYSTLYRYMSAQGLRKQSRVRHKDTEGARVAQVRLERCEVRSFEVEHVHGLWHLDFHHGSLKILGKDGAWHKPLLLTILDDHSRLVCHAQWYLDETAEALVHGFKQALQKRGLPRALMSDNGSAMMSHEFTEGLLRLGILHQPTLPYSPYQNAKQEVFWAQVESRLMAMLEGEPLLSLSTLNEATIAWVEFEYHRKMHSEIAATPLNRYLTAASVGRPCPLPSVLDESFCQEVKRKQRHSDGTFTLHTRRFEVPSAYRDMQALCVRYVRWDLSHVTLVCPHTALPLSRLYPLDKAANADGKRRTLAASTQKPTQAPSATGIAPLLKQLMAAYAATGLPPAYLTQSESSGDNV